MSITIVNFEEHYRNALKAHENTNIKYKPPFGPSFLEHTLPILASVKLETINGKISTKHTWEGLGDEKVNTPNGPMTGHNIRWLVKYLGLVKRNDLILGSQIRDSRLATFTPLMLYAHKLYNNVPYSKWDKTDKYIRGFLGSALLEILNVEQIPELTLDQKLEYRKHALTFKSGAKVGQQEHPYNYKCAISSIEDVPLPRIVIMMMLQIWLANAAVRNVDSMILDPIDWDNVPEPIDHVVLPPLSTKQKIKEAIKVNKETSGDIPWI